MPGEQYESPLKFLQTAGAFVQAVHTPLNERLNQLVEEMEATEGADGVYAQVAAAVYPQESSLEGLIARSPYTNLDQLREGLKESEGRGWLTVSETGFTATEKSLALNEGIVGMLYESNQRLEGYPTEVARAVELLGRLVAGAEQAGLKIRPTFSYARNYEYDDKTPSLVWVRRHLLTLNAFRDDCHLDAWQPQFEVPGYVFETFTFLWRGDANSAAKLAEMLPYRNFSEEDYAGALAQLAELGWAEKKEDGYAVTEEGKALREEVEAQTNKNYSAAFAVLSGEELDELIALIETLTAAITPEVEEAAQQA